MGIPVLIMGKSGSGKSTSLRNFPACGVISVLGKPLPFKNAQRQLITDDYAKIKSALQKSNAKSVMIDDAGYLMTNHFMKNHASQGAGGSIFTFYNTLGDEFWKLITFIANKLPPDKIVYLAMHEDKNDAGDIKPKSIGKMLDEKVCIEGLFSIVLRSVFEDGMYGFRTKTQGFDVAKTPVDMFDNELIDNDLCVVDAKIREYYSI